MSEETTSHYDRLLAEHYTWMFGVPFAVKVAEQRALLSSFGVQPAGAGIAMDLGSGPGFQSVALAQLGFSRVLAIDTSAALLEELASHAGDLPIETACTDLLLLPQLIGPAEVDVIVCMGDTLTHLESRAAVSALFEHVHTALAPGGVLVLTFRDLSAEVVGLDRIIPVHSDRDRIMTCVLEYERDSVVVNDLIHTRQGDAWSLAKSGYRKLRLKPDSISAELELLDFSVLHDEPAGRLHAIVARR